MKCIHEQVAKAWAAGDIVDTYRSLIPYGVVHLKEYPYLLIDIAKMLRSPAQIFSELKFENLILQQLISGYTKADGLLKKKISLSELKKLIAAYKQKIVDEISNVGKVFLSGINYEVHAKFKNIEKLAVSADQGNIEEAVKLLQQLYTYTECISVCVAGAIHSNFPYINDIIQVCLRQYDRDVRSRN